MKPIALALMPHTPVGDLSLAYGENGLIAIHFNQPLEQFAPAVKKLTGREAEENPAALKPVVEQLEQYFAGQRQQFDLPLDWSVMSAFQQKAMRLVYAIPFGQTRTYQQIAQALNNPLAIRAIGRANATNPISIVVPCHRVIGSNGKLHGYGGGLEAKAYLLNLEGSWLL